MQGSQRAAVRKGFLGILRLCPRLVEASIDEHVDAGITGLDAGDECVHYLDRRETLLANAASDLSDSQIGKFVRKRHVRVSSRKASLFWVPGIDVSFVRTRP